MSAEVLELVQAHVPPDMLERLMPKLVLMYLHGAFDRPAATAWKEWLDFCAGLPAAESSFDALIESPERFG